MTAGTLPSFAFDTAQYEEQDRIDAVADLWRNYLTFNLDPGSRNRFFLRSRVWWLNDCVFVNSSAAPMRCHRPPPPDEESLISVSYLRRGKQDYVANGALLQQGPDAVHVSRHGDQTIRHCHTDSEIFIFYLPAIRLGLVPDREFPARSYPTTTPVGAILRSVLLSLPDTLDECPPGQVDAMVDSICALLEPALRETPDTNADDIARFRLTAIKGYVEDNVRDGSLDATRICQVFGISRPTLYRLFKQSGGVMAYVAKRRTHHIYSELTRSSPRWGLVKSVAEKFGFDDMTHFTRTFRRHTGTTPRHVVGLSTGSSADWHVDQTGKPSRSPEPLIFSRSIQAK